MIETRQSTTKSKTGSREGYKVERTKKTGNIIFRKNPDFDPNG